MNDLGTFILERRQELGLTQRDIATRLQCSPSQVSSWEQGAMKPRKHVAGLAEILEVSAEELLVKMVQRPKPDPDFWKHNGHSDECEPTPKATLRPVTIPRRVKPSDDDGKRLLIVKHQILDATHSIQAILDVGLLVGDENTVKLLRMIVERLGTIEATAKGLVE